MPIAALLGLLGCAPEPALPFGAAAEDCGSCHAEHYDEWAGSAHARGPGSPVFEALLPRVEDAWGTAARAACEGCHAPDHGGDASIGCVSCHAAVGNHGESDGQLAVDLLRPLAGPLGAAATPTAAHSSEPRGLLTDEALCGTCHEVTGPGLFVEDTLGEFRDAPAFAEGRSCVDCHAAPVADRALTVSTEARPSTDHAYIGFDPPWGADPATAALAAEDTRALLASALSLRIEEDDAGQRTVVVQNTGAGHRVPTGVAFLRDLWVEVEVDGAAPVVALRIGDVPTRDGAPTALVTDADAMEDGSLAPGESIRAPLPREGAIQATLRGRAFRPDALDALGLSGQADEVPEIEIANARAE